MAKTVAQPSYNPTNKLTAATVTGALVNLAGIVLKNFAPEWYDPELMMALTPVVMLAVGWFVKDQPNVPGN